MNIAIIQPDTAWQDRAANFQKLEHLLDQVSSQKPELVVVPEMFATGYTFETQMMEDPEGPTFQYARDLARRRSLYVQATFPENCDIENSQGVTPDGLAKGFNTSVVFDPSGRGLCRYHKMHPFSLVKEHHFYNRGEDLPVFELGSFNAATPICYDLRFPEIFRQATYRGANLFIVAANWPQERVHHWRSLAIARAIENLSYVVAVNRVGTGGGMTFVGNSLVVSPAGEVLLETDAREQAVVVSIEMDEIRRTRQRFGFLNDVREDLFPDVFSHAISPARV